MLKKQSINISKHFFLLLFLGFFGSNTFFNHLHIVDGISIVHSHPFKSDSNGNPLHSHTEKGYITIQMLSCFPISSFLIIYAFRINAPVIYELISLTKAGAENKSLHYFYSLRAPPSLMISR